MIALNVASDIFRTDRVHAMHLIRRVRNPGLKAFPHKKLTAIIPSSLSELAVIDCVIVQAMTVMLASQIVVIGNKLWNPMLFHKLFESLERPHYHVIFAQGQRHPSYI